MPRSSGATPWQFAAWVDRQLPLGLPIAFLSAVGASAGIAAAESIDSYFGIGVLVFVAAVLLTIAWVVSWMVIEYRYFDWREAGRKASAYELIAGCTLEISEQRA